MKRQVEGKVALITGAASGIGRATAELLAQEGATVVLTDVDAESGQQVAESIRKEGLQALFLAQDVASEDRWVEVVSDVERRYGRLNVLVSNAGIEKAGLVVDVALEDWRRQFGVNVDGVFLSVKHCLPLMRKRGGGSIIVTSSTAGMLGGGGGHGYSCYSATKGAVRLFAKAIALECGRAADGVRVNSVHPGNTLTPFISNMLGTEFGTDAEGALRKFEEHSRQVVPLGRAAKAVEIAQAILFLASDASSYVTGTELVVDGGRMAGPFHRA